MAKETEIKLKIRDLNAFQKALKQLGAKLAMPDMGRVHEENQIFDTPHGGLAKHGQLLRIRIETPEKLKNGKKQGKKRIVLTFKRPVVHASQDSGQHLSTGQYKVREEIEVEVADAGTLRTIFEGLGMSGWFRYEKYRTTYNLPSNKSWAKGLLIELDETPIGIFAELEGPEAAIDHAAQALGYSKKDYVQRNYLTLYVEGCRKRGEEPRDMLFATGKQAQN